MIVRRLVFVLALGGRLPPPRSSRWGRRQEQTGFRDPGSG